jgi:hypothetical protein
VSESAWKEESDPQKLLALLHNASERKQRLFAAACCRHGWHLLEDERSRQAVRVAERFADGLATLEEMRLARVAAFYAAREAHGNGARAAHYVAIDEAGLAVEHVSWWLTRSGGVEAQGEVLRDLFGGVHAVEVSPSVRSWGGGAVVQVARAIYAEQRFEDVAVLADALEEAGEQEGVLGHLRGARRHYLGCWALDLLLALK